MRCRHPLHLGGVILPELRDSRTMFLMDTVREHKFDGFMCPLASPVVLHAKTHLPVASLVWNDDSKSPQANGLCQPEGLRAPRRQDGDLI